MENLSNPMAEAGLLNDPPKPGNAVRLFPIALACILPPKVIKSIASVPPENIGVTLNPKTTDMYTIILIENSFILIPFYPKTVPIYELPILTGCET